MKNNRSIACSLSNILPAQHACLVGYIFCQCFFIIFLFFSPLGKVAGRAIYFFIFFIFFGANRSQKLVNTSFVRSFLRGGGRPLADFRRAFSLLPALRPMRPRLVKHKPGTVRYSPLTLGLVLYIYRAQLSRRVSLAGCQHAVFL